MDIGDRPCSHIACSKVPCCIVRELESSMNLYVKGRGADTFRIWNTQRAVHALEGLMLPLETEEDVDALVWLPSQSLFLEFSDHV
jgi:hypothetical protein